MDRIHCRYGLGGFGPFSGEREYFAFPLSPNFPWRQPFRYHRPSKHVVADAFGGQKAMTWLLQHPDVVGLSNCTGIEKMYVEETFVDLPNKEYSRNVSNSDLPYVAGLTKMAGDMEGNTKYCYYP